MTAALGALWYPLRDASRKLTMRRHNRVVNVRWGPYTGPACYVGPPVVSEAYWGEPVKDGARRYFRELPPRRVRSFREKAIGEDVEPSAGYLARQGWEREPDSWQPLPADKWPDELPEPLPAMPQSLAGIMARVDHVKFDAAQAVAEMEDDRRRADSNEEEKEVARVPWWRDASAVKYSAAGEITPRECEGRVMRALYWMGAGELALPVTTGTAIGRMTASTPEEEPEGSINLPPLVRGDGETDERLLAAMDWVAELCIGSVYARYWVDLLAAQATDRPITYARLGYLFETSASSVHESEKRALRHLFKISNKGTPKLDASRRATVERNRAHARATNAA